MPLRTEPGPAVTPPAPNEWRTVRCENEDCRHIVFKFRREDVAAGGFVIQVKCRCKTMNNVRIRVPSP